MPQKRVQLSQNATALNLLRLPAGLSQGKPGNRNKTPPDKCVTSGHHGCAVQKGTTINALL